MPWSSVEGLPTISNFKLAPFEGGVALLETAAILTPGTCATLARICSKNASRAGHVL
jgi:hypothetical protein